MRLKRCVLSFLRKLVRDEISLMSEWKCILGTWLGDGKGFVGYMKPST